MLHAARGVEDLPLFDTDASRTLEARAAAMLPGHALMQRAGHAVACLARAVAPHAGRVCIVTGPGNNGGDGHEAAVHLVRAGLNVVLVALGDSANAPDDARIAMRLSHAAGITVRPASAAASSFAALGPDDLVIDALFGRGLSRPAEGAIGDMIEAMNAQAAPVLAVDMPSGLPGDTGQLQHGSPCVCARWTLALLSLAPGLFTARGREVAGEVWFDDLGVVPSPDVATPVAHLAGAGLLSVTAAGRPHDAHKGRFGDVWVVGGGPSMGGAALLAGRAAAAAGAGRVHVVPLDHGMSLIDPVHPELMFVPSSSLAEVGQAGRLDAATVVAGCGGGTAIRTWLPLLLSRAPRLVLDADALNALAADDSLQTLLRARAPRGLVTVMTPHPLEAARLLGIDVMAVQSDRLAAARRLADFGRCAAVLKGSGSVVAAPEHMSSINPTGNAALSTPGTGDVLAGWIGGLWSAQSAAARWPQVAGEDTKAFEVARAVVYLHGAAAEAAQPRGLSLGADALIGAMRQFLRAAAVDG